MGISIHYSIYGDGPPVMLLHAGMANTLPDTSHFAFLQDPERFNAAVLRFLSTV